MLRMWAELRSGIGTGRPRNAKSEHDTAAQQSRNHARAAWKAMTIHNRSRFVVSMLSTIAIAGTAVADDPPPSTLAATIAEPPPVATPTTVTAAAIEEPPAMRYPRAVIARPLTLPSGLAMIGADAGGNHDLSAMTGAPIGGYGITDELEVQVPYAFATRELEARGSLDVDVGYAVLRGALGGKLELVARVRGGYHLLDEAARPLMLGVHAQYNITDKLAVISGVPGTQQLRISLAEDAEMATPIDLGLPLGVGVQPLPELYLQIDTKLAQLALSESEHLVIFRDIIPVTVTAVYNVINALDVQAAIGTDVMNAPGDSLTFLVGARFYAGQL
jgi:hypothetical protein